MALETASKLLPLSQYGEPEEQLNMSDDIIHSARLYFLALYGNAEFPGNLNNLRAHLFATTKGDLRCLPPTENAFELHVLRSLHQIAISKSAHNPSPAYPSAAMFGRKVVNGKLVPIMITKLPKPTELQDPKYCRCKKSKCRTRRCFCVKEDIRCVIECKCAGKCPRMEPLITEVDSE